MVDVVKLMIIKASDHSKVISTLARYVDNTGKRTFVTLDGVRIDSYTHDGRQHDDIVFRTVEKNFHAIVSNSCGLLTLKAEVYSVRID